jgi:hypothetical protein
MLELALGKSGPFVLRPLRRRLDYKKEYEIFKLRCTLAVCLAGLLSLFVFPYRLTDAIFCFLLLYYYCSVILREHILLVNGSRIRSWWISHHYLSVLTSGLLLVGYFFFYFISTAFNLDRFGLLVPVIKGLESLFYTFHCI